MKLGSGTLFAIALTSAVTLIQPAIAIPGQNPGQKGQNVVAAPAPLIGASLPGLAIGYGVYWLIRRRRKIA
jgi:hypothetical protein